ncbi:hypothetical protein PV11_09260 [Exophiala sideris]|uniref:ABC transporter domain-containing protein n=1 Tax=Exophiala sideris TaxID=1016849 RepID=A0A0D1VN79_9EURO|nr:hypothetical protein PV11_09260 [Exophiala sideris]
MDQSVIVANGLSFEILVANEFHGRRFPCAQYVPAYPDLTGNTFVCSTPGSRAGESTVLGDDYIATFGYSYSHVWRNFGILCAFLLFFMAFYFVATELNSSSSSSAEVLVFRRGHIPTAIKDEQKHHGSDEEQTVGHRQMNELTTSTEDNELGAIAPQTDIFTWKDVSYDINTKDGTRRLLDNISGWVRPGTLTALMGASGAGKTTLLDVLAQRKSVGVITGATFVNGSPTGADFQRNTGYVQQQDLHLQTATVPESLRFSALLRQPASVSKADKYAYVEEVIKLLNMEDFAEAAVGTPGQGLNVEQRKLLSIGVELAAKPKLLLFLDEPTSGLDSQSSWAICAFLRKLADAGQAVLCTIHQPSAILFEQFDRLLFLAKGGKTVYFGDVGQGSQTLLEYFRTNGARECGHGENPAEYILEVITTSPSNGRHQGWHEVWQASPERAFVDREVTRLNDEGTKRLTDSAATSRKSEEFAAPFFTQLYHVTRRVFQQYWRTPTYLFSKLGLGISSGLFIGFSVYQSPNSLQGIQNVIFSIFMVSTIFTVLVQQIMPHFITQRNLYEVRERPSKAYSWKAFLIANIVVEIPYQIVLGIMVFGCWNYAVNGIQSSDRQVLILLFCIQFFVYASSFAHMVVAGLPDKQTASAIVTLLFGMSLAFNGVMQSPDALPGFWNFMYRVSPFTYWVGGIASNALHGRPVECSNSEYSIFDPPQNQTCGDYLERYLAVAPGYLTNPAATSDCRYCSLRVADQYMAQSNIFWSERWRNFGLVWLYFIFNIAVATLLYWALRVKRWDTVWKGGVGTSLFRKKGSRKNSRLG